MIYPQKDFKDFYYRPFRHRPPVEVHGLSVLIEMALFIHELPFETGQVLARSCTFNRLKNHLVQVHL